MKFENATVVIPRTVSALYGYLDGSGCPMAYIRVALVVRMTTRY